MRASGLCGDYRELHVRARSPTGAVLAGGFEDLGLEFSGPWTQVFDDSRGPEWTTWFIGGRAQHRVELRPPLGGGGIPEEAAVFRGEDGSRRADATPSSPRR